MPIFALPEAHIFPDPRLAEPNGLIAVGGDLSLERLLKGYALGMFPWYSEGQPILWHSPDPRFVLYPQDLRVSRSLRRTLRRKPFRLSMDTAFAEVVRACARVPRPFQDGTWITDEMNDAYCGLHDLGYAHSVEAWEGEQLVGGLYGVSLGRVFFGESMYAESPDASKVALVSLVQQLVRWGFELLDSQVYTEHLERFGAVEIPREQYLDALESGLETPTRRGRWCFDGNPAEAE